VRESQVFDTPVEGLKPSKLTSPAFQVLVAQSLGNEALAGVVQIRVTRETWNPLVSAALATFSVTHKPPVLNHAPSRPATPP